LRQRMKARHDALQYTPVLHDMRCDVSEIELSVLYLR
jgi:hypothetical protein